LFNVLSLINIITFFSNSLLNFGIIPLSFLNLFYQAFIIAIIAILSLIIIAAIVYLFSGVLDKPDMRAWSRLQIYQAIATGIILVFFISIIVLTYINPNQVLSSANLLPPHCSSVSDMYQAATCDLSVFNNDAWNYTYAIGAAAFLLSWTGGLDIAVNIPLAFSRTAGKFKISSGNLTIGTGTPSLMPLDLETTLNTLFSALSIFFIITNILIILLAGSVFWLISFVTLGLIARAFGVTRSFGGSMISLGLGLGIVLPILVIIMYGFITVQVGTVNIFTVFENILGLSLFLIKFMIFGKGSLISVNVLGDVLFKFAALFSGLFLIPFLIFTVLDAFIIDFSTAIGEKIDFMSMLTGLL